MRLLYTLLLCIVLSGCGLSTLISTLGGGTATKGHGNDNTAYVGSDVSYGIAGDRTEVDADDVHGDVTTGKKVSGNKHAEVADNKYQADIIHMGISPWWWLLVALLIPSPFTGLIDWIRRKFRRAK